MPNLNEEIAFINGVASPADYSGGYTLSEKWGGITAGTPGGTVNYYFAPEPGRNTTEKVMFEAGLNLWAAVAPA